MIASYSRFEATRRGGDCLGKDCYLAAISEPKVSDLLVLSKPRIAERLTLFGRNTKIITILLSFYLAR